MSSNSAASHHEAGHCIAALVQGGIVKRAICAPDESMVTTRFRIGRTPEQEADRLWERAITDLAGPAAEVRRLRETAWATDEANAMKRVKDIVTLRAGLDEDAPLTPELRRQVDRLLDEAHIRAREIVARYWDEIDTVAARLARGEALTGEDIFDALMLRADVVPPTEKNEEQAETV
jgi:hypothetical protein